MKKRNKQATASTEADLSRTLLQKSAELKQKSALLKAQMELTAKACSEILNPNKEAHP